MISALLGIGLVVSVFAGIPASLAITCVIGLGWGRATRNVSLGIASGVGGMTDAQEAQVAEATPNLYDPNTARNVMVTWVLSPTVAFVLAFVVFSAASALGLFTV